MSDDSRHRTYDADEYHSVSEAIADAVEDQREAGDVPRDVRLEDEFDPDALDALFQPDVAPQTSAELQTNDLQVKLWGDGTVEVRALGQGDDR